MSLLAFGYKPSAGMEKVSSGSINLKKHTLSGSFFVQTQHRIFRMRKDCCRINVFSRKLWARERPLRSKVKHWCQESFYLRARKTQLGERRKVVLGSLRIKIVDDRRRRCFFVFSCSLLFVLYRSLWLNFRRERKLIFE